MSHTHLFQFKDVLVEIALQLFISQIDQKLFQRVLLEHLEAKDVENSNRATLHVQMGVFVWIHVCVVLLSMQGVHQRNNMCKNWPLRRAFNKKPIYVHILREFIVV